MGDPQLTKVRFEVENESSGRRTFHLVGCVDWKVGIAIGATEKILCMCSYTRHLTFRSSLLKKKINNFGGTYCPLTPPLSSPPAFKNSDKAKQVTRTERRHCKQTVGVTCGNRPTRENGHDFSFDAIIRSRLVTLLPGSAQLRGTPHEIRHNRAVPPRNPLPPPTVRLYVTRNLAVVTVVAAPAAAPKAMKVEVAGMMPKQNKSQSQSEN